MILFLNFLVSLALPIMAFGAESSLTTTECIDEKCLESGWLVRSYSGQVIEKVECKAQNCALWGWDVYRSEWDAFPEKEIHCEFDCFTQGWREYFYRNQRFIKRVECTLGDCFEFGWKSFNLQGNRLSEARCLNRNCQKFGWDTLFYGRNQNYEAVRCENENCFEAGWKTYR